MTPVKILIVDDEPANLKLLRNLLIPMGYQVREADDGEKALAEVARELPDLLLLDVMMPSLDGYEVCRQLKSNTRTKLIPVVMLTSLDGVAAKLEALDRGADEFLTKPFDIAELTARVRSLVALKRYTDELENASNVLKGLAGVVERRDAYTGDHCRRVGEYGAAVAVAMGLDEEEAKRIRLAGMFHDLGKIDIPDQILRKPGELNDEERAIMMTHATTGADLMAPMNTLAKVVPLVRHHHERLDGSGYPDGLSGHAIEPAVRILTVVDIYDALATRRPYKAALPRERCLEILREEAVRGWWDRDVVEHLAKILPPVLSGQ